MIELQHLAELFAEHGQDLTHPVEPFAIDDHLFGAGNRPAVMGCINLSRDSTYRESIAVSPDSAIRKGRVLAAQGADLVDIGAESSTAAAARVSGQAQIDALVPVISALASDGIAVSVESYQPAVIEAGLQAGAKVVNYTGSAEDPEVFSLVAKHDASVIICYVAGSNVREITDVSLDADPIPGLAAHFEPRLALAREQGATKVAIDPGMGFFYGNLTIPRVRVQHQARVLLNTFRLRALGAPVCHAMPHAFDLFEDQFRTAEGFFTVLAHLGGTQIYRTHEVPQVAAVLNALHTLDTGWH